MFLSDLGQVRADLNVNSRSGWTGLNDSDSDDQTDLNE